MARRLLGLTMLFILAVAAAGLDRYAVSRIVALAAAEKAAGDSARLADVSLLRAGAAGPPPHELLWSIRFARAHEPGQPATGFLVGTEGSVRWCSRPAQRF